MSATASAIALFRGLTVLLLIGGVPAAFGAEAPLEVLRTNVTKAIAVLKDPRYQDAAQKPAQRGRLCEIAQEMFDPYLFSKLALGVAWERFSASERQEFVDSFAAYLCRYYLTQLQEHYDDESVTFLRQVYRSPQIARVEIEVLWQDARVPVKIRMALRDGHWKAYDMVLMGVSAVLVYRTQFDDALRKDTPAALIQSLREKTALAR